MEVPSDRRDEQGATLILVALLMVAMLTMVAIVLDMGLSRTDRRSNKSIADSAAIAAADSLRRGPWPAVCSAYNYVRANGRRFASFDTEAWSDAVDPSPTSYGSSYAGGPCGTLAGPYTNDCDPGDPTTWSRFRGVAVGGAVVVTIQSGYTLPDPDFAEDAPLTADNGLACEQVTVRIQDRREPVFGKVVGANAVTTNIRSVARQTVGLFDVAALVILERTDCRTINAVTNGGKIEILSSGNRPGIIQVDSDGTTGCSGASDRVVFGSQLPSTNLPNIIARQTATVPAVPGRVSIYAKASVATAGRAHTTPTCANPTTAPCTISPNPVGGNRLGRRLLDERYLPGLQARYADVTNRFALDPYPLFTTLTSVPGFPGCNFSATFTVTNPNVYIDCDLKVNGGSLTFSAPNSKIITSGTITVGSSGTLIFDDPRELLVQGDAGGGPNTKGFDVQGVLSVNNGTLANCALRQAASPTLVTKFAIGGGGFDAGGTSVIRMCQTSLLMMSGGLGTIATPAPESNSYRGWVRLGGQGAIDWSAPNIKDTGPASQADWDQQEDLALWSETEAVSNIGGGGTLKLEGVFAVPNTSPFRLTGQAGDTISANAQFWTHKLELSGAATLQMAPNPNDSVPSYDNSLVR